MEVTRGLSGRCRACWIPGVQIRPARVDDTARVRRIVTDAYTAYIARIGREPAPMIVDYGALITGTDQVSVLVDESDTAVGVLVAVPRADHLFIDNIAVAVPGRGYGRLLLDHAERQARRAGLAQLRLYTNAAMTENLTLYPHLGFVEVDRRTEDGFDRVYFRKDLRP